NTLILLLMLLHEIPTQHAECKLASSTMIPFHQDLIVLYCVSCSQPYLKFRNDT
ncbi:uncharacterized protein METZ01_LOCUS372511, partial [marine metagenome]